MKCIIKTRDLSDKKTREFIEYLNTGIINIEDVDIEIIELDKPRYIVRLPQEQKRTVVDVILEYIAVTFCLLFWIGLILVIIKAVN